MATAAVEAPVDITLLSSYSAVPESRIQTLIDNPSTDLVTSFLRALVVKAQDHDRLKSDRLRLDVELENAIRGGESRARGLKAANEKASQEILELRSKLNTQEAARAKLETQLQDLQSSTSQSSTHVQSLESQVAKLEQSNRDTLALLTAKSTSYDKLAEDLANQHQKSVTLRREISALEERTQNAENALSNAKFRESALQSEVELLKRNNAWYETELKTKSEEQSKSRKEKNARIAELHRANEEALQNVERLEKTESSLRKRVEELSQKADSAFSKIQQMQEEAATREEDSRAERESIRRLADLQQQSADTARRRVQELEDELEHTKEDAANELGQVQAELETEHQERESAEQKAENLETEVERLNSELEASQRQVPGTPRSRINGHGLVGTPGRAGSPSAFSPGSSRIRGGLTFTQLYTEHNALKTELEEEKRNHAKLREAFDQMLHELEQKQPELQEAELERDRLEGEVAQLSTILDDVRQEKDAARKDARKFQSQLDGYERRAKMLEQQLRDLSAQVKILLVEVQIRDQGVQLSTAEREQLQEAAQLASDGATFEGMSDTGRFISERLVAFKDVFELQSKNMELTKIVRELGESREEEEAKAKRAEESQDKIELQNLKDRVERYKDEMKSLVTQSQSYIRERDMFRRMLSHRGQLPPDADLTLMFGSSMNGGASPQTPQVNRATPDVTQTPTSKDIADYSKLLKELQSHFDAYRRESSADLTTVKAQVDALAKEKSQLQAELARANSQVTLGQERYQMFQSTYDQLRSETNEFRKRYESLSENAAKQDVRTQQVAEELVESKALAESIRNENMNLKAEKELWKRIEERLNEDNRALVEERTRLNKALSDTQHLSNERELSDSENRRKLQYQAETLDAEVKSLKQKLEEEVESTKTASMRREFEQEQSRTRIDDLVKSLGSVKEELVAAKTTRDQLQSRVDELKIELRTADERTQALQPRPTPRPNSASADPQPSTADSLSQEQELALEIANLKRELDLSKAELENARSQVEQYRAISQSSEEELQSLTETLDQYKEDADKVAGEKDARIQDLEQRLQDMSAELETSSNQLSELRASEADHQTHLDQQRTTFEAELTQIRDDCERYKETANMRQGDLKAQAELTQQAQQSYETELLKHAEAAKAVQKVRQELNELKLEVSQSRADAEAARTTLSQSEDSWATTKDRYESELTELKSRRDDVDAQNKLLHAQLESISAQITSLQQNRASGAGESREPDEQGSPSSGLRNLQEVIKYLRREKEIVDVQYELSVQESRRLKQQLDYSQSQLDEARLKLDNERQLQTDKEQNSINHKKLMDTINELNVFRESSVTLRNEARQAQSQLAEKAKQVEELTAQIEPLQNSIREMENQRETTLGEMKLLEEDRNRWQQRSQNILQKYGRIDPAELEEMQEKLKKLEAERDEAVAEKQGLQERVDGFDEEVTRQRDEARKELREKLGQQFKTRSKELTAQINTEKSEKQALQAQLEALKSELEDAKSASNEATAQVQTLTDSNANVAKAVSDGDTNMQNGIEEGQVSETQTTQEGTAELEHRLESAEKLAQDRLTELEAAQAEADTLKGRVTELENQVNDLEQQINTNTTSAPAQEQVESERPSGSVEKLKEHLSPIEEALRTLHENLSAFKDQPGNTEQQEQIQNIIDQIEAVQSKLQEVYDLASSWEQGSGSSGDGVAADLDAQVASIRAELETQYKTRVDNMRTQLSTKLAEGKAAYREQMTKEKDAAISESQTKLAEENKQTVENLQKQIEALQSSTAQGPAQPAAMAPETATTAPAETGTASKDDSTIKVKVESAAAPDQWTMPQVRTFISSNQHVKGIIASNIKAKLEQESAKIKAQMEKESTEKLEDARQKAEKAKENAVFIEAKKSALKLNMAENKARTFVAKFEVVEKAAKDTPQKPVVEVWTIAKDTKAPPTAQTGSQPASGVGTTSVVQPGTSTPGKPQAQAPSPAPSATSTQWPPPTPTEQKPAPATSVAPSTAPATAPAQQAAATAEPSTAGPTSSEGQPASTVSAQQTTQQPSKTGAGAEAPKSGQGQPPSGTGPAALRGLANQGSAIPRGGAAIRGTASRGGHAGASTNEQSQTSSVPAAGQASQRGGAAAASALPRGGSRGSIRGRGQAAAAQQGAGRGGGTMNAGARQFVPGNKRQREDSTGDVGNKRPRGGAQGT